jgi:hypothetical protein
MQRSWTGAVALAAVLLAAPGACLAQAPAKGKAAVVDPARLGGKPNLNGVWRTMDGADWGLEPHDAQAPPAVSEKLGALGAAPAGLGVVDGGKIPYLPAALEQREKNRKSAPTGDPQAACYLPGIPRATYVDHPFQIVQGSGGDLYMAYEYAEANRTIYMKTVKVPQIDTWMGTSYGAWEGDTLKVVTLSQNGMTWLDRAGDYLSPNATVTERFTPKDRDHILYSVRIEDPSLYSRPWTISMILYRNIDPKAQLLDFRCVPFTDALLLSDVLPKKAAR